MIPRASVGYKMVKYMVDDGDDLEESIQSVSMFVGLTKQDEELLRKEMNDEE